MDQSVGSTIEDSITWTSTGVTKWARNNFLEDFEVLPDVASLTFEPLDLVKALLADRELKRPTSHILHVGIREKLSKLNGPLDVFACIEHAETLAGEQWLTIRYICTDDLISYSSVHENSIIWREPFSKMTTSLSKNHEIRTLVCWFFLAKGYLDTVEHYRGFESGFKAACVNINKNGNNSNPTQKKLQVPKPKKNEVPEKKRLGTTKPKRPKAPHPHPHPHTEATGGDPKKAVLPESVLGPEDRVHERRNSAQTPAHASNAQDSNCAPKSPISTYKRARQEIDDAYTLVCEDNKRLKLEIGELKGEKERLACEKELKDESDRLRQELQDEKAETQKLRQDLAAQRDARSLAVAKADRAEAQLDMEKRLANEAVIAKARLEFELQTLKNSRTS